MRNAVPEESSDDSSVNVSMVALAALVVGLLYLDGGFVWDDGPLIRDRLAELDIHQLPSLWMAPATETGPGSAYYRPVALTLLSVLGRLGPHAVHALAVMLHVLSAVFIFRCCANLRSPGLGALAFAVHPLCGEVLGWSSALPDALAVSFAMGAVYVGKDRPVLRFVLLLFGVLSKETALLVPVAFVLGERRWSFWIKPWVAAFSVALSMRVSAGASSSLDWLDKLDLMPSAMGWAIGALVWPFPQHAVRDLHVAPAPIVLLGALVTAGAFWFGRRSAHARGGAALIVLAHAIAMPVALDGYLLGERYSYPALVGVGVWLAAMAPRVTKKVFLLLAGVPVYIHAQHADRWSNDLSLFSRVTTHAHDSSYAWHLLGVVQLQRSMFSEAAVSFGESIAGGHPYPGDRLLLIQSLVLSGQPSKALMVAEDGPQDDLTANHLAWWARAAWEAGHSDRAAGLIQPLWNGQSYAGPEWVPGLADRIYSAK